MPTYRINAVRLVLLAGAFATLAMPAHAARPRPEPTRAAVARSVRGAGAWQRKGRTAQKWDIDLRRRSDSTIEGRVTLVGSPLLRFGILRGSLDGRHVSGGVYDDYGTQVATFVGVITDSGSWEGTYQDRTGEVGNWSWSGQ